MLDFLLISTRSPKKGITEIYPKFIVRKSSDLMIRGGDFYAIWNEDEKLWSTDEDDALKLIDNELDKRYDEIKGKTEDTIKVMHLWDSDTGMIVKWHNYVKQHMSDNYHALDEKIIFSNTEVKKKDYASKKLPYPLKEGSIEAYDELMSVLYSPEERKKIEWAIGAVVSGDSKTIQKFMVLYGSAGTGKSTVLNIIQKLFDGYFSVFDAKALGSMSSSFALEPFKTNPLVSIQHDGDLSRIDDNTRLNSVVSHELMTVNEKFKSTYASKFNCFLFIGTNKPVKITDAKSGIIRRLIDVTPTGNTISTAKYDDILQRIDFELGAIAYHCLQVYKKNKNVYKNYIPLVMLGASNDFYNFVMESFEKFSESDGIALKEAWEDYTKYCEYARVPFPYSQKNFKEELKNYFKEFSERKTLPDGTRVRSYYSEFITSKFTGDEKEAPVQAVDPKNIINFIFAESTDEKSIFDQECSFFPAQYANSEGKPRKSWDNVTTTLADIDPTKVHYVLFPEGYKNHIIIDFDLKDENGNKSFERNLEAIQSWPKTYAEVSKSGGGIHLHYIYDGDVNQLEDKYSDGIEIKVFSGKQSLRRKLTLCTYAPIAHIGSGLPLKKKKEVKKSVGEKEIKTDIKLREMIENNMRKEYLDNTKPSVDFIKKIFDDAYKSNLSYNLTDMYPDLIKFAASSSNNSDYCRRVIDSLPLKSDDDIKAIRNTNHEDIVFYDVEVFPNLLIICYKARGKGKKVQVLINPTPDEIEEFLKLKLVGYNCRKYDNHILHSRRIGSSIYKVYLQSKRIINKEEGAYYGIAYNYSLTDVLDFASKKQSLKKYEIEFDISHKELGLDWDAPVPRELWNTVVEYCKNDVLATEEVFEKLQGDFIARQILANLADGTENDTTNSLTTKLIFGSNRTPQKEFNYRFLGDDKRFKGYKFAYNPESKKFKSTYKDFEVGEGGFVYAEPGMYGRIVTFDVASMHPSSIIAENLFGDRYTAIFKELVEARKAIKHKDFERAGKLFDGKLKPYLTDKNTAKQLSTALKIAINSVYGLTAASFPNAFRDDRNKDNIVAKRGALFMVNLLTALQEKGVRVIHIKTDSIKIEDPSPEISQFILDFGRSYGYEFEIEHVFEKFCLVNDAVYIAKCASDDPETPGEWNATGTQFAVPYVFKTLFSHEDIVFKDLCETKSVTTAIYLDMNEDLPDVTIAEKRLEKIRKELCSMYDEDDPIFDICSKENVDRIIYGNGNGNIDEVFSKIIGEENVNEIKELRKVIDQGHNYIFVGRVGLFTPIKKGCGGGLLRRKSDNGKYAAVTGTKGYRWMESEMVKTLEKEADIDISYYENLVDEAIETINKFGDYEWFVSEEKEEPNGNNVIERRKVC